jgi:hypothetical protein
MGTNTLKLPTREPRTMKASVPYYDWETVIQDNGQRAQFRYKSDEHEKGWVLNGYLDEFGFSIVGADEPQDSWYLKNAFEHKSWPRAVEVAQYFGDKLTKGYFDHRGEVLFKYSFGDILSMREGYFVIHVNAPEKIIRIIQTAMS